MTLEGVTWIVVVNGVVQLAGLVFIGWMVRDVHRMTRALAGLVYQEEEKTRARLEELGARLLGQSRGGS